MFKANIMKNLTFLSILFLVYSDFVMPVNAQITSEGPSAQFLYSDFTDSKVIMKNGQINSLRLNFNTLTERMVYQKDDILYDISNPEMTDTVFLHQSKFIPLEKSFYEVLLNAPVPFYVQYKGTLLPPGTPAGYGGNSQVSNTKLQSSFETSQGNFNLDLPSDYKVRIDLIYWIKIYGKMISFTIERQFLKLYPSKESELKQFIKQNRIKFDKSSDIKKLAEYFNNITI
jgi:hypothetical protein